MPATPTIRPELPSLYEPVHVHSAENLAEVALKHARAGAPEGTLVWTTNQASGIGRQGQEWESPPEGLYAAVILRPEFDWHETGQIALVGLVALGSAVATLVEPMTELRYRWPNDLLVGGTRIAGLWLHEDRKAGWLTLVLACNVGKPPAAVFDGGCLREEGGNPDIGPTELLEQFARQFLWWLNVWADEGIGPILREFSSRSDPPGTPVALVIEKDEKLAGSLAGLDSLGRLQLELDGKRRTISIRRFFGLQQLDGDES
jgi:BirA family biotin operon repressor/biotin-[acetyl-CoA-carboxylase] ligase